MVKFVSGVVFFLLTIACSILLSMATTLAPEALQERGKKQAVSLQFKRLQSHLSPKLWTHATLQGLHQDSETESFATTERKTVLSAVMFFFFSFFPFSTSKIQLIALRESLLCSPVVSWGQSVRGSGGSDMLLKVQINGSREKKKHSWVHTVQGGFGHYYD